MIGKCPPWKEAVTILAGFQSGLHIWFIFHPPVVRVFHLLHFEFHHSAKVAAAFFERINSSVTVDASRLLEDRRQRMKGLDRFLFLLFGERTNWFFARISLGTRYSDDQKCQRCGEKGSNNQDRANYIAHEIISCMLLSYLFS